MGILDDLTDVAVVGVQTLTIFELKQALTLLMIWVITPLQECRQKTKALPRLSAQIQQLHLALKVLLITELQKLLGA